MDRLISENLILSLFDGKVEQEAPIFSKTITKIIKGLPSADKITFHVIDTTTGKEPDIYNIALREEWAKELIYCDMDGFYFGEDGDLILADECGHFVFCDPSRFEVVWEAEA